MTTKVKRWRIDWIARDTGYKGHGEPIDWIARDIGYKGHGEPIYKSRRLARMVIERLQQIDEYPIKYSVSGPYLVDKEELMKAQLKYDEAYAAKFAADKACETFVEQIDQFEFVIS